MFVLLSESWKKKIKETIFECCISSLAFNLRGKNVLASLPCVLLMEYF